MTIKEKLDALVKWNLQTLALEKNIDSDDFQICSLTGHCVKKVQLFGKETVLRAAQTVGAKAEQKFHSDDIDQLGFWYRDIYFFSLVKKEV